MFITELCTLLDLPQPDPAGSKRSDNTYVFERSVTDQLEFLQRHLGGPAVLTSP